MKKRRTAIYVTIGIGIVLSCLGLWWFSGTRGTETSPQKVYKISSQEIPDPPKTPLAKAGRSEDANPARAGNFTYDYLKKHPFETGDQPFDPVAHFIDYKMAYFKAQHTAEELADPIKQQQLALLASPAYKAFIAEHPIRGTSEEADFFESHGVDPIHEPNTDFYSEQFRKHFRTGEPEDFEKEMRSRLATHFRDAGMPPDWSMEKVLENTDHSLGIAASIAHIDAEMERFNAITREFQSDPRNEAWAWGMFQDNITDRLEWERDVLKNSEDILTAETENEPTPTAPVLSDERAVPKTPTDHPSETRTDSPNTDTDAVSGPTETADTVQDFQKRLTEALRTPLNDADIDAQLEKQLPTEQRLTDTLRERFSPERLKRVSETLERYGPEEGLRKVREQDPELAEQMERLIEPNEN